MPTKVDIDLSSFHFWFTALLIYVEPFFKPVIGVNESKHRIISKYVGKTVSFFLYCLASNLFTLWTVFKVTQVISSHPRTPDLSRNSVLYLGYLFLIAGLCIKIHTYRKYGFVAVMGGKYFRIGTKEDKHPPSDPYYHPSGTATVVCFIGYSLIQASVAGLFYCIICSIAYVFAYYFEKFHLTLYKEEYVKPNPKYMPEDD
ncbi:uncharacterized protein LOC131928127 isoform X2 [Physella acuta]|nr:uncharacterized protein LOC131928127 isoform X2 [Physella acuta]